MLNSTIISTAPSCSAWNISAPLPASVTAITRVGNTSLCLSNSNPGSSAAKTRPASESTIPAEALDWAIKSWSEAPGETSEEKIDHQLKSPDKPENLSGPMFSAIMSSLSDGPALSARAIEDLYYLSQAQPAANVQNWITAGWPNAQGKSDSAKLNFLLQQRDSLERLQAKDIYAAMQNLPVVPQLVIKTIANLLAAAKKHPKFCQQTTLQQCPQVRRTQAALQNVPRMRHMQVQKEAEPSVRPCSDCQSENPIVAPPAAISWPCIEQWLQMSSPWLPEVDTTNSSASGVLDTAASHAPISSAADMARSPASEDSISVTSSTQAFCDLIASDSCFLPRSAIPFSEGSDTTEICSVFFEEDLQGKSAEPSSNSEDFNR
ncbi:hypothetical protein [Erwinia sp. V71]|uniref:hypothetical protein n=1 Tax=Erwinia sp. V71 TaxID=3369424 RepID=UPI003F5F88FA